VTVCIDTNVLLQARSKTHPFHPILRGCALGTMNWAVSQRILTEYREMITAMNDHAAWGRMEVLLDLIDATGTLLHSSPYFQFQVIVNDPDDNAFTDCAISVSADYIITKDSDFAPLKNAGYKPQPITPEDFIARYRGVYV
jgi:putative PIN family toxin of toxin-antitoxin system